MTIQVHCQNGSCLEFPDGTPPDIVEARAQEHGGRMPMGAPGTAAAPAPAIPPEAILGIVQGAANVAQALGQQVQALQQAAAQMTAAVQALAQAASAVQTIGPMLEGATQRIVAAIAAPTELVRDQAGRAVASVKRVR